jgi:hypothetical protein
MHSIHRFLPAGETLLAVKYWDVTVVDRRGMIDAYPLGDYESDAPFGTPTVIIGNFGRGNAVR